MQSIRIGFVFFALCLVALFTSCSSSSNPTAEFRGEGIYVIDMDSAVRNPDDACFYSILYKGIKTIFLETSESCLIGFISKMRVFDEHIFILDSRIAKSLFVFNREGRFVRKIGAIGGGPGEFTGIADFTINPDNKTVYTLDDNRQHINIYDISTGRYLRSINLEYISARSRHFEYLGGKLYSDAYFFKHSPENYLLRVVNESSGKEESRHLNVMEYNKGFSNTNFVYNNVFQLQENGNLVFVQRTMDRIIKITKDSIFSLVDIKGKNVLSTEDVKKAIENDPERWLIDLRKTDKYCEIKNVIELDNRILFDYIGGRFLLKILFDKNTRETYIFNCCTNDLLIREKKDEYFRLPALTVGCRDTGGVYYLFSSTPYSSMISEIIAAAKAGVFSPDLDKLEYLKNLETDANPVIFYHEFKD